MFDPHFHCPALALAATLAIAACDGGIDGRRAASEAWRKACPEYAGSSETFAQLGEDALMGESRALQCKIAWYETRLTPPSERDLRIDRRLGLTQSEPFPDPIWQKNQLALMYLRWRLYGEGRAEMEALARTMSKNDIESAMYLTGVPHEVLARRASDACGRVAKTDPAYEIVMLGTGEREPRLCQGEP